MVLKAHELPLFGCERLRRLLRKHYIEIEISMQRVAVGSC